MSIFDKPKPKQTNIEAGQTRVYKGLENYKKPCKIENLLSHNMVEITINARYYNVPLRNIGELCSSKNTNI